MAKKNLIDVYCFGQEIGRLGLSKDTEQVIFQYNEQFLDSGIYKNLFPPTKIIRRIKLPQKFRKYDNDLFRGLPPQIADSLPDMFGNLIFKKWLAGKNIHQINVLEQLAYVANRGMGALEYRPSKKLPANKDINLEEIIAILQEVILQKKETKEKKLTKQALLNIFKMGTSAGGARPKILVSEHKKTKEVIPGDLEYSADFHHYLVKFSDTTINYPREVIEYCYYLIAIQLDIRMMPSQLMNGKYFATQRFDRVDGKKKHVLTATGITGWNFKESLHSSYENLFQLCLFLKLPHKEIEELYRRMVFNIVFHNTDDHLKNHSFVYDELKDRWHLSPAYDLTYSLNPLLNFKETNRALSVNGKRQHISLDDLLTIADAYTIKNPRGIIRQTQDAIKIWEETAYKMKIPSNVITAIIRNFHIFDLGS